MIVSVMAGYDMMLRVIGIAALEETASTERRRRLAAMLQHLVDEPLHMQDAD